MAVLLHQRPAHMSIEFLALEAGRLCGGYIPLRHIAALMGRPILPLTRAAEVLEVLVAKGYIDLGEFVDEGFFSAGKSTLTRDKKRDAPSTRPAPH